jgi:hypothetical protein
VGAGIVALLAFFGLMLLVILCISIVLIRQAHAHHVNILWYTFFLTSSLFFCIVNPSTLYLD